QVFLGQLQVVVDPELAAEAIAELQALTEDLFFLPIRRREVLAALQDVARASSALPHAAAVLEVWIGKLLDAGPHHEVGVVLHLPLVDLTALVDCDFRHFCIRIGGESLALSHGPAIDLDHHSSILYTNTEEKPMAELMNPDQFRTALEQA